MLFKTLNVDLTLLSLHLDFDVSHLNADNLPLDGSIIRFMCCFGPLRMSPLQKKK